MERNCAVFNKLIQSERQSWGLAAFNSPWQLELFGRLGEAGQTRDADEYPQVFS